MSRRRVVVTGLGVISPIGNTVSEAWKNALAGTPGINRISRFDPSRLSSQIAGEVKGFDVAPYMSPKEARRMDFFIHYGMAAGLQAWRDAALQVTPDWPARALVQASETVLPTGLTMPRPVTTTLRRVTYGLA